MIFGTPSKKDCAQNFSSLRWNLVSSWDDLISAEVFSSTQLIGASLFAGLQSHTVKAQ